MLPTEQKTIILSDKHDELNSLLKTSTIDVDNRKPKFKSHSIANDDSCSPSLDKMRQYLNISLYKHVSFLNILDFTTNWIN